MDKEKEKEKEKKDKKQKDSSDKKDQCSEAQIQAFWRRQKEEEIRKKPLTYI